ncbi:MAG: hypothetical protein QGG42_17685 [Phycisphaerae bacterium]|jgi:hypothetical protein|nr:hypothetical protein [Phycisphaerae bacterium]
MKAKSKRLLPAAALCGTVLLLASAAGAANCSLRNPDRQIYAIYPKATSYRSIVAKVGVQQKRVVEQAIGIPLALSDLGKHTVYIVMKGSTPIGFVHARSEVGKSGLVEFVWSVDLNLRIRDFVVERGREKHMDAIRTDAFRRKLIGAGAKQLRSLLSADGKNINTATLNIAPEAEAIARCAILSAAKMQAIMATCFFDPLLKVRLMGNVHAFFPDTAKVTKVNAPLDASVAQAVKKTTGSESGGLDPKSLTVLRAIDKSGKTLGLLVFSKSATERSRCEMWWAVSAEGVIQASVADVLARLEICRDFNRLGAKDLGQLLRLRKAPAGAAKSTGQTGSDAPNPPICAMVVNHTVEALTALKVHGVIH